MSYGAGLLIYRPSDGRILLTRRAPYETHAGRWDGPGGGVEPGESYLEAAIREGREELGGLPKLKIHTEPVWWAPHPFFAFASFLAEMDASGEGWEPSLSPEHDSYGWFALDGLPGPILEGTKKAIAYYFG